MLQFKKVHVWGVFASEDRGCEGGGGRYGSAAPIRFFVCGEEEGRGVRAYSIRRALVSSNPPEFWR